MKKILFFAAAAIAMLASCSQNDDLTAPTVAQSQTENTPVSFGTYIGRQAETRAGATGATNDDATLQANSFGVFGYHQVSDAAGTTNTWSSVNGTATPNFMYNQLVSYSSGWTYSPIKYWPNGIDAANAANTPSNTATQANVQYLNFFAYSPYVGTDFAFDAKTWTFEPSSGRFKNSSDYYDAAATANGILRMRANDAAGHPKVMYRLAQGTNFVDLLWGMRPAGTYDETDNVDNTIAADGYNTDLTKQSTLETVDFKFKHALAKIGGSNGLKILADIDNNTTSGETGSGSLAATTSITVQQITIKNSANSIVTDGWFDLSTGTWAADESGTALSLATVAEGAAFDVTLGSSELSDKIYSAAASNTYNSGTSKWNVEGVTTSAKDVYQTSTDAFYLMPNVADQKLKIGITYEIRTYDTNLSGSYSTISQTITNEVTLPALSPNKNYKLIIHLGLTSVKFAAVVSAWDNATSGEEQVIYLPSNVVL